jgi:putative SOS response-associated peptidase YedK
MCGRFVQERSITELAELFEAEPLAPDPGPSYNLAPTDPAAVVVQRPDGPRGVTVFRWGLVPPWARNPTVAARHINARAETIAASPVFRDALRRRRCIVPADAFYEWTGTGRMRQPHLIRRVDRRPLAFAGLWATWRGSGDGLPLRTFTIVTTRASAAISSLHDRMPVVLQPDAWATWLDPAIAGGELLALLEPAESDAMEMFAVPPLVIEPILVGG